MKKTLAILITLFVLIGLNLGISYYTHSKYLDDSFFVGLSVTVIILFFTSKGGLTTRRMDMKVRADINVEQQKFRFSPNLAFFTSLIYTIFSLVITLYIYRDYL